ncbi:MAG TPA: penicillin-binding transpeptidase domain-containing protein [Puia sp.]|jgi:beta-lactamase class D|nr:penicillin-binding transpeptidase domain-containing protein [Puia sp.]
MKTSLYLLAAATFLFSACSSNNVTVDDSLGHYFDSAGVKGTFALLDNGQGRFTIYNLPRYRDSLYPAAQTFDILQTLVAFQTGILPDEKKTAIVEDSSTADPLSPGNPIDSKTTVTYAWAMRDPGPVGDRVYRQLADSIGIDTLKKWVDSLQYGDKDIKADSGRVLIRGIRINADQQLGLVKKLYFNQLPFFRRPQDLVKGMLTTEVNSNYKLVYKTGRAAYNPGPAIGWVIGWVQENEHPYFFVINLESPDGHSDVETIGIQLAKKILPKLGFFQGKK